jgi:type I restriction enzyme S subunit
MRRYTDYKDSGSAWIGYMPNHWTIRRIKDIGAIQYGLGQPPEYKEAGLPFVRATNVTKGKITDEGMVYVADKDVPTSRNPLLRENDIIVVRSGANTADSALVPARYAGAVAGYDMVIRAKSISPHYLSYSLLSSYLLESQLQLQSFRAAQPHLNKEQLGHALVLCPPLPEQQAIADYLDVKTAKIDRKIDLLTHKAAKYRQLKQALINAAITRGLDKSVPMKDSRVEWIDKIPEHWQICHLKRTVKPKITDGPHESPIYYDQGVPFVSAEAIQNGEINFDSIRGYISPEQDLIYSRKCKPMRNDIFIVKSGSTTGKIGYVSTDVNFQIWSPLALVRPNSEHSQRYVFHFLSSECFQAQIRGSWSLGTQPNIGMGVLENLQIFAPQLDEQTAIAEFIDERGDQIDRIIAVVNTQITKLKDLRKSLINDIVTGKLRVT